MVLKTEAMNWHHSIVFFIPALLVAADPSATSAKIVPVEKLLIERIYEIAKANQKAAFCASVDALSEAGHKQLFLSSTRLDDEFYFAYLAMRFSLQINTKNELGENASFYVIEAGEHRFERLRMLSDLGLNILSPRNNGETIIHAAIRNGRPEFIEEIFQIAGESCVNVSTNDGTTPLMLAAALGDITGVKILIGLGANTSERNDRGQTATDMIGVLGSEDGFTGPRITEAARTKIRDYIAGRTEEK